MSDEVKNIPEVEAEDEYNFDPKYDMSKFGTFVDPQGRFFGAEIENDDTHILRKLTYPGGDKTKTPIWAIDTAAYTKQVPANANKVVYKNGYCLFYNHLGYVTKMLKAHRKTD